MLLYVSILLSVACLAMADDVILQKRMFYPGEATEPFDPKVKKPFCNAFTGCGKKRSGGDSMATLVDLNSEPAVEELSRQILSEAKLWEAIQEARMELNNRKQQEEQMHPLPLPLTGVHKRSQYLYT
ncbi:cardioactive peptide [Halyomorpha halys]|uniref:cardioactive peptide n=1 Tax=Halyomorpha halys TaxID=286706 RepID=UPI0006D4F30E|nr:cardioactive peptide [Halyomorpha halys]